jgi:hypothetical protein
MRLGKDVLGVDVTDMTPMETMDAVMERLRENRGETMDKMDEDKNLLGSLTGLLKNNDFTMTYEDNIFLGTYLEFTKENSGIAIRITLSKELRVAVAEEGLDQWAE